MKIQRSKRIGKVLLIVEGGKHEFNLMKKIFVDALGYTQIEKRRGNTDYYKRSGDLHSITSVNEREYLDNIFPSVEAYEISNFLDNSFFMRAKSGSELKAYINDNSKIYAMNKISEESICHALLIKRYFRKNRSV